MTGRKFLEKLCEKFIGKIFRNRAKNFNNSFFVQFRKMFRNYGIN